MNYLKLMLLLLLIFFGGLKTVANAEEVDVCIYGGTSAGVIAAYTTALEGKTVLLIEPGVHLGGMSSGGLGLTDIGNKFVVTGLARDFYRRIGAHYGKFEQWIFEPSVAENIFKDYVKRGNINVLYSYRLKDVKKKKNTITGIVLENSKHPESSTNKTIQAKVFIDCSYEGDLMAKAGVSYTVGREANQLYNETYNGVQLLNGHQFWDPIDPYIIPGDSTSGLIWGVSNHPLQPAGSGDKKVQAYNFRVCLTSNPNNRISITRPDNYDSTRYELALRLHKVSPRKSTRDFFIWSGMPNSKTDINNNGGISSDMIGMNWDYPDADYDKRAEIWKAHEDYTKGFFYFLGHDDRVPEFMRTEMLKWGYPKDEYIDNNHWSHQLYIREARRMIGELVMTQHHCVGEEVVTDAVGWAAYTMDSHNCDRLVVNGMVKNEGNVEAGGFPPYPISYRAIVPKEKEVNNLLVPVCLSASHIAYGSIRMEPVFMVLAQSAALAACQAIDHKTSVQKIDVSQVQKTLQTNPLADGSIPEILIDNDDEKRVSLNGEWSLNKDTYRSYGLNFFVDDSKGKDAKSVRYTPEINFAGEYQIYLFYPKLQEGSTYTTVRVFDGKTLDEKQINRNEVKVEGQTSGEWVDLGKYRLGKEGKAYVEISNKNADNVVAADAVLFFPVIQNQEEAQMNQFIDNLISQMTLEEKIGQLNLPTYPEGGITTGSTQSKEVVDKIRKGLIGGIFNVIGIEKVIEIQKIAANESRLKIPLLFGLDVIHGYKTTFPIPLGLAATWDMNAVEQSARIAAIEASADGINWTFSPMVDISRDPRWGRVAEGAGEDPFLGGEIAKAMVKGYQGDNTYSTNDRIMACVKHFALYGAPDAGRDYNTVDMSRVRMYNEYLYPYQAAINAGAGSLMASFNEIDGVPATANRWLLTDLLRKQWEFKGFVVTDYTGITEMINHGIGDFQTVSARALKAGVDMDMVSEGFLKTLPSSLEEKKVKQEDIDNACRKILEAKYKLGLFKDPFKYGSVQHAKNQIFTKEHRSIARKIASESFVLLKNEKNTLPLKKNGTIAIIGPLANTRANMPGTWSVAANLKSPSTLVEGIQEVAGKEANILYAKGSNVVEEAAYEERATIYGLSLNRDNRSNEELLNEALSIADKSDVIIAALGETARMNGEGNSRTKIDIPEVQRNLLAALLKTGKPVVLVLFTGRPLTLVWEQENVPAILNVWFGGTEAGPAIGDVLFGDVNPSGKLTMSFPQNEGQIPIHYNHKNTGRPSKSRYDMYLSNYLDVSNDPLYPFGFGLSYTDFEYGELELSVGEITNGGLLTASITVSNTGTREGWEIVQLYIRDVAGSITRPVKELKGFERIFLKAGESKKVSFEITPELLKFYNSDLKYDWEAGEFEIMIGSNSRDVKTGKIMGNK